MSPVSSRMMRMSRPATSSGFGLEGADLVGMAQRERDVVEAVDEAVLAERLHVESELGAVGLDHDLALEVDRQLVAHEGRHFVEQARHLVLRQLDRQQAVLEAV